MISVTFTLRVLFRLYEGLFGGGELYLRAQSGPLYSLWYGEETPVTRRLLKG